MFPADPMAEILVEFSSRVLTGSHVMASGSVLPISSPTLLPTLFVFLQQRVGEKGTGTRPSSFMDWKGVRSVISRELWGFSWREWLEENHCVSCLKQDGSEAQRWIPAWEKAWASKFPQLLWKVLLGFTLDCFSNCYFLYFAKINLQLEKYKIIKESYW